MVRLLVFTSEPLLAMAVSTVIGSQSGDPPIELCRIAADTSELAAEASKERPEVLLVCLSAGVNWGLLSAIRRASPESKLVLWADEIPTEIAHQLMAAGLRGILRRHSAPELMLKCIRKVHAGELWFEKSLTEKFLSGRTVKLSPREGDLVRLLAQGLKNKEIASELGITEGSVKVYLSKLFLKTGAKDRFELALFALRHLQHGSMLGPGTARSPQSLFLSARANASTDRSEEQA